MMSIRMEDRVFIADKSFLLDERYVFPVSPLPDGATPGPGMLRKRKANYRKFTAIMTQQEKVRFEFSEMTLLEEGHYTFSGRIVLNRKYIRYLLQRIPEDLLAFGMTGDERSLVHIYRGPERIGVLMPFLIRPKSELGLQERAAAGDADAQYLMGKVDSKLSREFPITGAKALKWYAAAARQGHAGACLALGQCFREGRFVARDLAISLVLIEQAIEMGSRDAIRARRRLVQSMPSEQFRAVAGQIAAAAIGKN